MLFWCECLQSIVSLLSSCFGSLIYGKNGNLMRTIIVIRHKVGTLVWIWPVSNFANIPHSITLKLSSCLNNPLGWSSLSLHGSRISAEWRPFLSRLWLFSFIMDIFWFHWCCENFRYDSMLDMCVKCAVKFFDEQKIMFIESCTHLKAISEAYKALKFRSFLVQQRLFGGINDLHRLFHSRWLSCENIFSQPLFSWLNSWPHELVI